LSYTRVSRHLGYEGVAVIARGIWSIARPARIVKNFEICVL